MNGASARLVAGLVIALALVTGVVAGVAADRRLLSPWGRAGGGPYFGHGRPAIKHLRDELGLSSVQAAAIDSIIHHRMAQRDSILSRVKPQIRQTLDSTRIDIEQVLTPDQRVRFQAFRDRAHSRFHFPSDDGSPSPPGPDDRRP